MKKHGLIVLAGFIIGVAIFSCCTNNKNRNSLTKDGLKGKVKTIEETRYDVVEKFGELQKGSIRIKATYEYDENGNLNEQISSISNRAYGTTYTNKYNEKGNLIGKNIVSDALGRSGCKFTYKYDENGNRIEEVFYDSTGRLYYETTSKFDEKGNQIEYVFFNPRENWKNKETYEYDKKGNQIGGNYYDSSGRLTNKITYKYDEKGNQIEFRYCNSDGKLKNKYTYKYNDFDKEGNWRKKVEFTNNKPTLIIEKKIEYYPKSKEDKNEAPVQPPKIDSVISTSSGEASKVDISKLQGKWVYAFSENKETGEIIREKPNYSRPDEYRKDGIRTYYDLKGNKLSENYTVFNDVITYSPDNVKKRNDWKILVLNENVLRIRPEDKSVSYLIATFERYPDDSQGIDFDNIYATWEQYKFINKSKNTTIEGADTWSDGQNTIYIYSENGSFSIGSIKNNSVAGKFSFKNNILKWTFTNGDTKSYNLLKLTKDELVYSPASKSNLVFFHKRIK